MYRGASGPMAVSMHVVVVAALPVVAQPGIPLKLSHVSTREAVVARARAMLPSGSVEQSTGGAFTPRAFASSQAESARVQPRARSLAALASVFWHFSADAASVAGTAGGLEPYAASSVSAVRAFAMHTPHLAMSATSKITVVAHGTGQLLPWPSVIGVMFCPAQIRSFEPPILFSNWASAAAVRASRVSVSQVKPCASLA